MTDYAIIGLQFGSEGKGALAGYLANRRQPDVCVSNWSPNAGHTFRETSGHKLVVRCIPVGAYSGYCQYAMLGPGSVIDPVIFLEEMSWLPGNVVVVIHPMAAIVYDRHRERELQFERIGSTMKGSAAASIDRMMRDPLLSSTAGEYFSKNSAGGAIVDASYYHSVMSMARLIQVEGCQGHSLSLYNGLYPYVTSRDTSIHQLKADVAWHDDRRLLTYGCIRTFPIRVANRAAGTSGHGYPDQMETSFRNIGVEPEFTTVTKLPRRVFTFSLLQLIDACTINNPHELYLSFCDYFDDDDKELFDLLTVIREVTSIQVKWQSYGPYMLDMIDHGAIRNEL